MDQTDASLAEWLEGLGLGQYAAALIANDVDLDILPELDAADLRELGFSLGHARRLLRALREGAARPGDDGRPGRWHAARARGCRGRRRRRGSGRR